MVAEWQKSQKMHHLVTTKTEEDKKHQHKLEKFDKLSKQKSNSVRDLVALAAQICRPPPEKEDPGVLGYWSNPEEQV